MIRTVKIFISSTFKDMNAERDVFIKSILPRLKEKTENLGIAIREVDLRWGVTEEQVKRGEATALCLDGIEESRPYFLCFLGDRYGWIPPLEYITVSDFEYCMASAVLSDDEKGILKSSYHKTPDETRIYTLDFTLGNDMKETIQRILEHAGVPGSEKSITEKEIDYGVLTESLPRFIYGLDERIVTCVRENKIKDQDAGLIFTYYIRSTADPVWRLVPGLTRSGTDVVFSVLKKMDALVQTHSFFYFRKIGDPVFYKLPDGSLSRDYYEPDQSSLKKLDELKNRIRKSNRFEKCREYPCSWNIRNVGREDEHIYPIEKLNAFEEMVFEDLYTHFMANPQLKSSDPVKEKTALQKELDMHQVFINSRVYNFRGREPLLQSMEQAVNDVFPGEVVSPYVMIEGEPGSGKSALCAQFYSYYKNKNPDVFVIPWFIGATAQSGNPHYILKNLCEIIIEEFTIEEEIKDPDGNITGHGKPVIPDELDRLRESFIAYIRKTGKKVLIILDALNQVQKQGHYDELNWLPDEKIEQLCILFSCIAGKGISVDDDSLKILASIEKRRYAPFRIPVGGLTSVERKEIIRSALRLHNKELPPELLDCLVQKKESYNPLYLIVAVEELKILHRHEDLKDFIQSKIPETTEQVFDFMLTRIEKDMKRRTPDEENRDLFGEFVSFLAAGKHGMNEDDLPLLLGKWQAMKGTVDVSSPRLNDYTWGELRRSLRSYLIKREDELDFFHLQLKNAVVNRYLPDKQTFTSIHRIISEFLFMMGYSHLTAIKYLPYHLLELAMDTSSGSSEWKNLVNTLCDLDFIENKARAGFIFELGEDFKTVLAEMNPEEDIKTSGRENVEECEKWRQNLIHYASSWKKALNSWWNDSKINHLPGPEDIPFPGVVPALHPKNEEEIKEEIIKISRSQGMTDKIKAYHQFIRLSNQVLGSLAINKNFTIQHAYNFSDLSPVSLDAEKMLLKRKDSVYIMKKRNWKPFYNPESALVQSYFVNASSIDRLHITPDGKTAIASHSIIDLEKNRIKGKIKAHISSITADGTTGTAMEGLYDLESGFCIKPFKGIDPETIYPNALGITADGGLVLIGGKTDYHHISRLFLYDTEKECIRNEFFVPLNQITHLSMTPDGRKAVILDRDTDFAVVFVCDCITGEISRMLETYLYLVRDVKISSDGKKAVTVSGSENEYSKSAVRIFDAEKGSIIHAMEGHWNYILSISLTPDGCYAVSAGQDKTINIWGIEKGELIKKIDNPYSSIIEISIDPEARYCYTIHYDGYMRVWNIKNGMTLRNRQTHHYNVHSLALSPDSAFVFSCGRPDYSKTRFIKWETESGNPLVEIELNEMNFEYCTFNQDRNTVTGLSSRGISLLDAPALTIINEIHSETSLISLPYESVLIRNGEYIMMYDHDGKASLLNIRTGKTIKEFKAGCGTIESVYPSAEGRIAFIQEYDHSEDDGINPQIYTLGIWDAETGTCIKKIAGSVSRGRKPFDITPDGRYLIFINGGGNIRKWDLINNLGTGYYAPASGYLEKITVTPDGKRIVALHIVSEGRNFREKVAVLVILDAGTLEEVSVIKKNLTDFILTKDARYIALMYENQLLLYTCEGEYVSAFAGDRDFHCFSEINPSGDFLLGTGSGDIMALHMENLALAAPVITGMRYWLYDNGSGQNSWDKQISSFCPFCHKNIPMPEDILSIIREISQNTKSGSSVPPDDLFNEKHFLRGCPFCENTIHWNPFIHDMSEVPGFIEPDESIFLKNSEILLIDTPEYDAHSLHTPGNKDKKITYDNLKKELAKRKASLLKLEDQIAKKPHDVSLLFRKVDFFTDIKNKTKVMDAIDAILAIDPENIIALNKKGCFAIDMQNYSEAGEAFDKILLIDPRNEKALFNKDLIAPYTGEDPFLTTDITGFQADGVQEPESVKKGPDIDRLLEAEPENDRLWCEKGKGIIERNRLFPEEAFHCFNRAIEINPSNSDAYAFKGLVFGLLDMFRDAESCIEKALKIDPHNTDVLLLKAKILSETGRYTEALDCYNKIPGKNPGTIEALLGAGYALYASNSKNNPGLALGYIEKAYCIEPENTSVLDARGMALFLCGEYKESLQCVEKILKKKSFFMRNDVIPFHINFILFNLIRKFLPGHAYQCNDHTILIKTGLLMEEYGMKAGYKGLLLFYNSNARALYEKVLLMNPSNQDAMECLKKIDTEISRLEKERKENQEKEKGNFPGLMEI